MKTCAACGRPLASHGGKAAIQSSEIGPKAADTPCCGPQGALTPDSPKSAQEEMGGTKPAAAKPKGTKRHAAKVRIRALRVFARKKLGHFLPARITLRARPKVEQTASEAPRPRRRAVPSFRPKRRIAKTQPVVSKPPEMIETPSASQAATDETERLLQIQPIEAQLENKTEEPQHVVATSAEQMELSLPLAASSHAGEQSPQTQATETQLEQKIEESQHAIATSAGQIELSWPAAATTDPGDQSPQTQTIEAQPEQRTEEPEQVVAPLPENIEPASPSDMMSDAADPSAQTAPAEAQLEMCAEDGGTDGTLFQTEDLVFVPWRADEPVDVTEPAPETPVLEEQAKAPVPAEVVCNQPEEPHIEHSTPASAQSNQPLALNQPAENPPTPEAPVEKVAQVYPMIPPAPNAPVPRREEFEARLQMPANPQSKESLVEKKPVELVPGLSADSAAPCEPPISEPVEPENASCKIEDAAEEAPPTSAPLPEQLPTADFPNPVEPETAAMTANLESCVEQTVAPEPEMEVAIDLGGYDNKSEKNLEQPPKKKVLVVDDDPTLRMLLKMGLEPHGYECLLAEHGKAAQAVVQANHPAVILVDLLMPVMDGLAFVEWLRGTAKDSTPVLVFTNLDDAKITQQALDSGANAFACKPLRLKELLKTMKELVAA